MENKSEKKMSANGCFLRDIQITKDDRGVEIDQVGVCDLRYPIIVLDRQNERQHTMANISMSVNLPHQFKGTHMSRFLTVLNRHRGEITMRTLPTVLAELKTELKVWCGDPLQYCVKGALK